MKYGLIPSASSSLYKVSKKKKKKVKEDKETSARLKGVFEKRKEEEMLRFRLHGGERKRIRLGSGTWFPLRQVSLQ